MPNEYTTIAKVQDYLGLVDADFSTTKIELFIQQISQYIETFTGRIFYVDASTTSRKVFEVKSEKDVSIGDYNFVRRSLEIPEAVEVVLLDIDGDEIDPEEYLLYPANDTPKLMIKLKATSTISFTIGEQNIGVSARWGYSATTPLDIEFASTILSAGMINNSLPTKGSLQTITLGRYSATFKSEKQLADFERAKEILESYKKVEL